ncbi:MAG: SpoIID/LytB domain-containing protein [Actinomycetota bacterium]
MKKRSRSLVAVFVMVFLATAPMADAAPKRSAPGSFVFHGSGYGHGIGMSQYGALGLAQQGWTATQIVRHYYSGVKVVQSKPPDPTIAVGLLQNSGSVRLEGTGAPFDLVLESGELVESVPAGSRRTIEITTERTYRVVAADGTVVGDRTWGGPGNDLIARVSNGRIRVIEWGHEAAHGELRFDIVANGKAHLSAVLPPEEYLLGLAEVPSSWPKEALGAQAIAGRTYAYWRLAGPPRAGCSCDVFSSTADQNYTGWDKEAAEGGARWAAAVQDTNGRVITYGGSYIYAVYSSSSGGYTENIESVWPAAESHPYLRGVCDPGDIVDANPSRFWTVEFQPAQITTGLRPFTGDIGQVVGFDHYERGISGRVTYLTVVGTSGSAVVEGWDVRSGLSLKDTRFAVNRNLNISGDIRSTYDRLGCAPGRATTSQQNVNGGSWQAFVGGRLYDNDSRGSVTWLRGAILGKYLEIGGPTSKLGLPYRVKKIKRGQRAWFDRGTITCTRTCRAHS